jgi:hypothetical protein
MLSEAWIFDVMKRGGSITREPITRAEVHSATRLVNGWHLLLRDYQAAWVWADVEGFIRDPKAQPPSGSPPIPRPERERNTR